LVTYDVLSEMDTAGQFVELVFLLAILAGLIKLLLGLLKMGGIIRYISNSVLTGFLAAIGILITLEQFGNLFGITIPKNQGALAILLATFRSIPQINLYVTATAAVCIVFMLIIRRIDQRLPAAMLSIIFAALLVQVPGWHGQGIKLVSDLGLPAHPGLAFHVPQVSLQNVIDLIPTAGAVALFSLVEAMSIARALSLTTRTKIDPSREFIGQGLASIAGGLMQCIPSSGSPSRSAVNRNAGARTRLAAAFSGSFVFLMMVIFSAWIGAIPMPGLAAVVVVSAVGLIDREHILLTWNTRKISRLIMAATFAATLLFPLNIAIYLGVLLSILVYLYESSQLHLSYLVFNEHNQVIEKPMAELFACSPKIAVVNVEGDLFFGAVNELETSIERCQQAGVRVLILRLRRMRMLASTGITSLQAAIIGARLIGMTILFSEVNPRDRSILDTSRITELVGAEHVFESTEVLFEATRQAIAYAGSLVL
jgi:SulP family sulfate permease